MLLIPLPEAWKFKEPRQDLIMETRPVLCIFVLAGCGTIASAFRGRRAPADPPSRGPPNATLIDGAMIHPYLDHVMTISSRNDRWEVLLECDGGSGGCEDPRGGFGVTQEEAEAAAIAAARESAWREVDGRWLCPLCYWRVCYWQAISSTAHSQQGSPDPAMLSAGKGSWFSAPLVFCVAVAWTMALLA